MNEEFSLCRPGTLLESIVKTLFMFPYTVSVMFICIISGRLGNENKKRSGAETPDLVRIAGLEPV